MKKWFVLLAVMLFLGGCAGSKAYVFTHPLDPNDSHEKELERLEQSPPKTATIFTLRF